MYVYLYLRFFWLPSLSSDPRGQKPWLLLLTTVSPAPSIRLCIKHTIIFKMFLLFRPSNPNPFPFHGQLSSWYLFPKWPPMILTPWWSHLCVISSYIVPRLVCVTNSTWKQWPSMSLKIRLYKTVASLFGLSLGLPSLEELCHEQPHGKVPMARNRSLLPTAVWMSWEWTLQPQSSLQMPAGLPNSLTVTLWGNLRQTTQLSCSQILTFRNHVRL